MASNVASDRPDAEPLEPRQTAGYDSLDEPGQAMVRAGQDKQLDERRGAMDLEAEFTKSGRSWSEADAQGNLIRHPASVDREGIVTVEAHYPDH